ncbi:hypothetical protein VI08_11965 [Luteibacter yeojuensis]|uniref:Uncharacterized protein n=1 Tax=Luteibacter yeojuensis TaxID=345309 RepID=A0A0F3KN98_9GAMM|nr:hypothetical protein [Luteibacter yeojuensis]KJV32462.1 hypothetical protein VI08_11965 [Luteibacter yeojuensis]
MKLLAFEQDDARADIGGGMVQAGREPGRDGARLAGQQAKARVDAVGRRVQRGIQHHVAAAYRIPGDARAGQVERDAVASAALVGFLVLRVHGTHASDEPGRA